MVTNLINKVFKTKLKDVMSGYRVMNNSFVKNIPITTSGFEIETELTIQALNKGFRIKEIPIRYKDRPKGSSSKINTYKDGLKILKTILWFFKDYKPLLFFSIISGVFFLASLYFGIPPIIEYLKLSYVYKIPSAILATGLMLISLLSLFSGFILDTIVKCHKEEYEVLVKRK